MCRLAFGPFLRCVGWLLASSSVAIDWCSRCWLTALYVQDLEYGMRSLPPALELFCESEVQSLGESADKRIMSALFVPSLQAMKLREVEDLARQPESRWRDVFSQSSLQNVVASIKGTSVLLPRAVAASVLELTQHSQEELGDMDVEAFKRDIASLQVGYGRGGGAGARVQERTRNPL